MPDYQFSPGWKEVCLAKYLRRVIQILINQLKSSTHVPCSNQVPCSYSRLVMKSLEPTPLLRLYTNWKKGGWGLVKVKVIIQEETTKKTRKTFRRCPPMMNCKVKKEEEPCTDVNQFSETVVINNSSVIHGKTISSSISQFVQ